MSFFGCNPFLWVFMRLYGSFGVVVGPHASVCVLLGPYRSLLACLHVHFWEPNLSSRA